VQRRAENGMRMRVNSLRWAATMRSNNAIQHIERTGKMKLNGYRMNEWMNFVEWVVFSDDEWNGISLWLLVSDTRWQWRAVTAVFRRRHSHRHCCGFCRRRPPSFVFGIVHRLMNNVIAIKKKRETESEREEITDTIWLGGICHALTSVMFAMRYYPFTFPLLASLLSPLWVVSRVCGIARLVTDQASRRL